MNTIKGGLSLNEALAQLREHYEGKRENDPPGSGLTDAALAALASLEWHVTTGGVPLDEALSQLVDHYSRKRYEVRGNLVERDRLGAAMNAMGAVEWHTRQAR